MLEHSVVEFRDSPIKWIEAHPVFTAAAVAILIAAVGGIWGLLRNDQPQPPPQTNITQIAKIIEATAKGMRANSETAVRSLSEELNKAHRTNAFTEHAAGKIDDARKAVSEGRLEDADGLLAEAQTEEEKRLAKETERAERRRAAIADMIAEQAGIALLALNYQEAAKFYSKSADATPAQNKRTKASRYLFAGDAHRKKGTLKPGWAAYEQAMNIFQGLAGDDPSNAEAQRDLSVSYERIGEISAARGDHAGALENYRKSLAIRERLAGDDPSNAQAQRDLMVSYARLIDLEDEPRERAAAILDIVRTLRERDAEVRDLDTFERIARTVLEKKK